MTDGVVIFVALAIGLLGGMLVGAMFSNIGHSKEMAYFRIQATTHCGAYFTPDKGEFKWKECAREVQP